jgi:hypothetical protein
MERVLEGLAQAAKVAARERKIIVKERERLSMIRKRSREVYRPSERSREVYRPIGRIFKHQETTVPRDSFKPS